MLLFTDYKFLRNVEVLCIDDLGADTKARVRAKPEFNEFSTQSPVCNRDDGLPFRVADLTISFAKWRSKSIEALGNAWVPQVAFEIFKAIEENYKNNKLYEENNV